LDRRVEAVAPIEDPRLKIQLQKLMDLYLRDSRAWQMQSDGQYCQRQPEGEELQVQATLMKRWHGRLTPANRDT
jgi:polyphosphate kinase